MKTARELYESHDINNTFLKFNHSMRHAQNLTAIKQRKNKFFNLSTSNIVHINSKSPKSKPHFSISKIAISKKYYLDYQYAMDRDNRILSNKLKNLKSKEIVN